MYLPWEKQIWEGLDPIETYRRLMDAFEGDPEPILLRCLCPDPDIRAEGRARVRELAKTVFPTPDPEATYLAFMDWVRELRAEYQPLIEAGVPSHGGSWRDVCGYWFCRHHARYLALWVAYRAVYLNKHGLQPPKESYDAITSSPIESAERAYDERADAFERSK